MSYKYFGKLAGLTSAFDALDTTAPPNTATPFNPQAPATKFMAYGENATSEAFNRAFGALSSNIDSIKGALDAPALRREVLSPSRRSTDSATSVTGFPTLSVEWSTNPSGVTTGATAIDLAHVNAPPTWVYVGLHESELSSLIRLYRSSIYPNDLSTGATVDGDRAHLDQRLTISPSSVRTKNAAAVDSYFPAGTTYDGDDLHSIPNFIPFISEIESDAAPYFGSGKSITIYKWESDGIVIRSSNKGFSDYCLRPGCYLKIVNDGQHDIVHGQTNNGLYQIASIQHSDDVAASGTGDKAVLTRGNLTRVTVADPGQFVEGALVLWRHYPNHDSVAAIAGDAPNYAHVVHILERPDLPEHIGGVTPGDLYLSVAGASEDFSGQKTASTGYQSSGRRIYGNVGLPDPEADADSNWSLPIGTNLWCDNGGFGYAEVLNVIAPSAPLHFWQGKQQGIARPCNPLGFLLSPTLVFEDGNQPVKGDYYAYCSTLTTVGEQLRGSGASASRGSYEDPAAEMVINYADMRAITDFARHVRGGYDQWVPRGGGGYTPLGWDSQYAAGFNATKMILGNDIYYLEMEETTATGVSFEDACDNQFGGEGLSIGQQIFLEKTGPGSNADAMGLIVSVSGNYVVLSHVLPELSGANRDRTFIDDNQLIVDETLGNLNANGYLSTVSLNAGVNEYKVALILSGNLSEGKTNTFTPTDGLNAVYHNDYAANQYQRGAEGTGNEIGYTDNERPITVFFQEDITGDQKLFQFHSDAVPERSIRLIDGFDRATGAYMLTRISLEWGRSSYDQRINAVPATEQKPLTFFDENTNAWSWKSDFQMVGDHCGIPLTGYDDHQKWVDSAKAPNGYSYGFNTNYANARAFDYRGMPKELNTFNSSVDRQPALMEALEALKLGSYIPGDPINTGTDYSGTGQAASNFGALSNGILHGAHISWSEKDQDRFGTTYGGGVAQGTDDIDIGEAWFVKGGAKIYQPETRLSLGNELVASGTYILFFHFDNNDGTGDYVGRYRLMDVAALGAVPAGWNIWDNPWTVPVCQVVYNAAATTIETVIDCRQRISREDTRGNIYVGRTGDYHPFPAGQTAAGDYPNQIVHFETLGEAFAAIGVWETLRDSVIKNDVEILQRYWTIEVISHTFEWPSDWVAGFTMADAAKRGLSYPFRVPANGLTVIGRAQAPRPDDTNQYPIVMWGNPDIGTGEGGGSGWSDASGSPEQNLIDLNGKSGLVFRDLSFTWLGSNLTAAQNIAINRDIAYDYGDPTTWYANMPGCNLFINRTATPEDYIAGGPLEDGDRPGLAFWYAAENTFPETIFRSNSSRNILIENVHLTGGSGFLFHVDYPNFDNLTIRDCSATHISNTFVTIESVSADRLDGSGLTSPGYHTNVVIEDCFASSRDNLDGSPDYSIEYKFSNAIHLTGCANFKVDNCMVQGFLTGVCARHQDWWYTRECWVNGFPANLPAYFGGVMPAGVDGLQPSFGTIANSTFTKQYRQGIIWHSISDWAPINIGRQWGGITITDCVFKEWAVDRIEQSAPYKDVWEPQDTMALITRYGAAPAIQTVGADTLIKGNKFVRVDHGPNWNQANPSSEEYPHHVIDCWGAGRILSPNHFGAPMYFLDDDVGNNIIITDNSTSCVAGHSFLRLFHAAASVVSGNTEDAVERQNSGATPAPAKHYPNGFRFTDYSVHGYDLHDVNIDGNVFACKPLIGTQGNAPTTTNTRVRVTNNIWGAWPDYMYRFFTTDGGGTGSAVAGQCESIDGVTQGNNFNGLDIIFSGEGLDSTGHTISDNNFAANPLNTALHQKDDKWFDDFMLPVTKMGGSIILDYNGYGGAFQGLNNVRITNNRTNGGNIMVGSDIDPHGGYSMYHNVTVSGNDLTHTLIPNAGTWNSQFVGRYGLYSGGRIRFGGTPMHCIISDNHVGAAINNEEGGIQVGFGKKDDEVGPDGGVGEPLIGGPNNCTISGNNMQGSVIKTAGWMFDITGNTAVGGIFHNATVYDELLGGPTGRSNTSADMSGNGLYHWKIGVTRRIDFSGWIGLTSNAIAGGSHTQIKNNQFANKNSYAIVDPYSGVAANAMENYSTSSTDSPLEHWGPMIALNRAHQSTIDGNQGVRLIVAQDCQGLRITNNDMANGREHWNGGHGFTFGYGGHMELFGLMTGAIIEGNKLIWERAYDPDDSAGYDQKFTYNVNQLPLANGAAGNNSTIPYQPDQRPFVDPFEWGYFPERAGDDGQLSANFENVGVWGENLGLMKGVWMEGWSGSIFYNNAHHEDGNLLPLDIDSLRLANNTLVSTFWDHSTEEYPDIQNPIVTGNMVYANKWYEGRLEDYDQLADLSGLYRGITWFRAFTTGIIYTSNISYTGAAIGKQGTDQGGIIQPFTARGAYAVVSANQFKGGLARPKVSGGGAVFTGNNYSMYATDGDESWTGPAGEVHGFYTKHDLPGNYSEDLSRGGQDFGVSWSPPGIALSWAFSQPEGYSGLTLIGELGGKPLFFGGGSHWTQLTVFNGAGWAGVPDSPERYVAAMGLLNEAISSEVGGGYIDAITGGAGTGTGYHNETAFPVVGPTSHWLNLS